VLSKVFRADELWLRHRKEAQKADVAIPRSRTTTPATPHPVIPHVFALSLRGGRQPDAAIQRNHWATHRIVPASHVTHQTGLPRPAGLAMTALSLRNP
jgi:hypothetical protein